MQVGDYEVCAVETGRFALDGGAMFGVVPKVLWERTNPADDKNRIPLALRALLVRGRGRVMLVDCGIGEKWSEKHRQIYAIDHSRYQLDRSLAQLGLGRGDITDVIISHLHFDHVGGATSVTGEGKIELTFPRADYYIQRGNLDHAHAPTEKDRASFLADTIEPLQASGKLKAVDGEVEFAPGVTAWVTHGHTPGQQLVKIAGGDRTVLFCADTIPTASHIPPAYIMGYDNFPLTTLAEKKVILERAAAGGWALAWVHDPVEAATTVRKEGERHLRGETVAL